MKIVRIGEVCNILSAGDKPKAFSDTKTDFFNIPVYGNGREDKGLVGYTNRALIKNEAITISARGFCGTTFYHDTPYTPIVRLLSLIPKNEIINAKYLYYQIKNRDFKSTGSVQSQITIPQIADCKINIEEDILKQEKIANILFSLDSKINCNCKIIKVCEKLIREIYDYWFIQFNFPDKDGSPYKTSGGEMIIDEMLKQEIPKGWKVMKLGDIIEEASKSPTQVHKAKTTPGDYPFFTSGNEVLTFNEYYVDGFNIFLNTGGNADIKAYYGKAAYSSDTWCISAKEYTYMLYIFLDNIKEQINNNYFAGSGLRHLQKDIFKKIKLVVPEKELLHTFNEIAQSLFQVISLYKSQNKELGSLRDWLLPMLMNGQVSINN